MAMNSAQAPVTAPGVASANWGGRGGWGGGWRHHDDGGDILTGVLILGGIAAVAAAASSANHDRRARDYPPPPPPEYRGDYYPEPVYPDAPPPQFRGEYPERDYRAPNRDYGRGDVRPGYGVGNGSDVAQQACAEEIERDGRRIDGIDSIDRDADGWSVAGRLRDGREFSCNIGRDGRPESVTVEGHPA
ncbi:MAG: hypothetical protein JF593_11485 [Novosphingobium sp.]|nr:hypothetical protein [Novosphingobium sp.]